MAVWGTTTVTQYGLDLQAKAVAEEKKIEIYAARGGVSPNLTLSDMPVALDIAGKKSDANTITISLQIDNKNVETDLKFNRIALFAYIQGGKNSNKTPYAIVSTDNDELEVIPSKDRQYKVLRVDVVLAYTAADNVVIRPTIQLGITAEQAQEISEGIMKNHDLDPQAHQVMTHNMNDADIPHGDNGTIRDLLSRIGNRLKAITGENHWWNSPVITLAEIKKRLDETSVRIGGLDFIPTSKIGTSSGQLATLGWGGRFAKGRLPSDVVYSDDFDSKLGESGYQKFPGGLVIQWGHVANLVDNGYAVTQEIYFPTPFPHACAAVAVSIDDDQVYKGGKSVYAKKKGRMSFTITLDGVDTVSHSDAYWFAIGY